MVDTIYQSTSSRIAEAMTALDALNQTAHRNRAAGLELLRAVVADPAPHAPVEDEEPRQERDLRRLGSPSGRLPRPDRQPWVPLPPHGNTGSGPWGPKVRAKLIAEALAKRGWA